MARLHPLRRRSSSPYNHNHTLPSTARFFIMALITIAILLSDASPAEGQWQLSNGLISLQVGFPTACGRQVFPSITALSVMGDLLVPPYCDGALFQMTSRSIQGNDYNPTQAGDCAGRPSVLAGIDGAWNPAGLHGFEPGILLAVNPRNYNGGSCGCCAGDVTPYLFYWGMAMGSDAGAPKEVMFIYQSIHFQSNSAPTLYGRLSEMPSVYYDATQLRFVYYMPNNDRNWVPMALNGNNDIQAWGNMGTVELDGFGVMVCTSPGMSFCAALYYGGPVATVVSASYRPVPDYKPFSLLTIVGCADQSWKMDGSDPSYYMIVLNAYGNAGTVNAAIAETVPQINSWGNFGQDSASAGRGNATAGDPYLIGARLQKPRSMLS